MGKYYLAVDIGASSGRHIAGWVQDGRICLREVYRFENGTFTKNGHLCWDVDRLFDQVLADIKFLVPYYQYLSSLSGDPEPKRQ